MDKYELVKDIGSGNFGVARLMRNKETKELVAMKYIERGHKVNITFFYADHHHICIYRYIDCHLLISLLYMVGGLGSLLIPNLCNW